MPVTKATNCLLALTRGGPRPGPALACIRCGRCAEACPGQPAAPTVVLARPRQGFGPGQDYNLFDCIECGCCAQVCPTHIPWSSITASPRTSAWAREQEKRKAEHARARHDAKQARLERQEQERKANLRKKKEGLADKAAPSPPPGTPEAGALAPDAVAEDPKKAAIEAALKRAAEKKAALASRAWRPKTPRTWPRPSSVRSRPPRSAVASCKRRKMRHGRGNKA